MFDVDFRCGRINNRIRSSCLGIFILIWVVCPLMKFIWFCLVLTMISLLCSFLEFSISRVFDILLKFIFTLLLNLMNGDTAYALNEIQHSTYQ